MKQLLKRSIALVVLLTTIGSISIASANQTHYEGVTTVNIDSIEEGSHLYIKDKQGFILYTEEIITAGNYTKRFDFSSLPNAEYYFEIEDQNSIKVIPFSKSDTFVEIRANAEEIIAKPEVEVKGKKVYISQLGGEAQSWNIAIYYNTGYDLVYTEELKNMDTLNRIYDFSTSEQGDYTLVLSCNGKEFTNRISF